MFHQIKKYCSLLFIVCAFNSIAQITFSEHIAPIIYNKCCSCHHAGGIAPIDFTNYENAKKYAALINMAAIESKFMPPWMPDTTYSHFIDERTISNQEAELIKKWIADGMPQGNKFAEPEVPSFPKGSELGKPDLTVSMAKSFPHKGDNKDEYQVFVLPTNLTEGHNVSAIEIQPGNPKIAHHIILGLDTTQYGEKLDAQTPEYGYEEYSGFGFYPTYPNWSGWVPGNKTRFFPAGVSNYILPHSKILLQMHYGPSPLETTDSTVVNVFYSKEPVDRYLKGWVLSPNDIKDGPFFIKANTTQTFHAQYKVVGDCSLISVTPHAHWLGKKWEVYAIHPNGDTTHLIRINDWDFNWQNFFSFKKFIKLEKGSVIYCNGTYDNTEKNYRNPNHPIKNVTWGESAKDEMFLFYFAYVDYKKGDENIEIGGSVNYLNIINDNTSKKTRIDFSITDNSSVSLKLCDDKGKIVKQFLNNEQTAFGKHQSEVDTKGLKPGIYYCKMTTANYTDSKKIVIE